MDERKGEINQILAGTIDGKLVPIKLKAPDYAILLHLLSPPNSELLAVTAVAP